MIPWSHIASSSVPGGTEELKLMRRGAEFAIRLGPAELMNSRLSGSEEALAALTIARLGDIAAPKLLIGGLGMGFTLRAALAGAPPGARVVVAELVPAVVAWARGPMAEIFAGCLDDPRVRLVEGDVGATMGEGGFDAILLDVDNGPEGQTRASNDGLYSARGLGMAKAALRPRGLLSVWSIAPNDAFLRRFETAGFTVEQIRAKANAGRRGARHVIWVGRRT